MTAMTTWPPAISRTAFVRAFLAKTYQQQQQKQQQKQQSNYGHLDETEIAATIRIIQIIIIIIFTTIKLSTTTTTVARHQQQHVEQFS